MSSHLKPLLNILLSTLTLSLTTPVFSQSAAPIEAPTRKLGDNWVWVAKLNPRDSCSDGFQNGKKISEAVIAVTDKDFVTESTHPYGLNTVKRTYAKDFSRTVAVLGKQVPSDVFSFPMVAGKKWDATLRGGSVVTTLSCEQGNFEKLKVGDTELDVVPIACRGRWVNGGNGDVAEYKFWYSPLVANMVRSTVFTYWRGGVCVDQEFTLDSYKRAE